MTEWILAILIVLLAGASMGAILAGLSVILERKAYRQR